MLLVTNLQNRPFLRLPVTTKAKMCRRWQGSRRASGGQTDIRDHSELHVLAMDSIVPGPTHAVQPVGECPPLGDAHETLHQARPSLTPRPHQLTSFEHQCMYCGSSACMGWGAQWYPEALHHGLHAGAMQSIQRMQMHGEPDSCRGADALEGLCMQKRGALAGVPGFTSSRRGSAVQDVGVLVARGPHGARDCR